MERFTGSPHVYEPQEQDRYPTRLISQSVHPNTKLRVMQMADETGKSASQIVAAILALYFGTQPPEGNEE